MFSKVNFLLPPTNISLKSQANTVYKLLMFFGVSLTTIFALAQGNGQYKEYRLSHIFVADKAQALDIIEMIKKGQPFEVVANRYSQDIGSQKKGGSLGWVDLNSLPNEYLNTVRTLKVGEISNTPIKAQGGYGVIKLNEVRMLAASINPTQTKMDGEVINAATKFTGKHWIADTKGCWHFNSVPMPNESLEWTGSCKDSLANGYGMMRWFQNGKVSDNNSKEKELQFAGFGEDTGLPLIKSPPPSEIGKYLIDVPKIGHIFLNFNLAKSITHTEVVSSQPYLIKFMSGNVAVVTYSGELCASEVRGRRKKIEKLIFPVNGKFTLADGSEFKAPKFACDWIESDANLYGNIIFVIGDNNWRSYEVTVESNFRKLALDEKRSRIAFDERALKQFNAAFTRGACDEAMKIASNNRDNNQIYFDAASCAVNYEFTKALNSKDPQQAYLAGIKLETNGERSKAKAVYLEILNRFPKSPIAINAADRLARLSE